MVNPNNFWWLTTVDSLIKPIWVPFKLTGVCLIGHLGCFFQKKKAIFLSLLSMNYLARPDNYYCFDIQMAAMGQGPDVGRLENAIHWVN